MSLAMLISCRDERLAKAKTAKSKSVFLQVYNALQLVAIFLRVSRTRVLLLHAEGPRARVHSQLPFY